MSVNCQSSGTAAVITPDTPPTTNISTKPAKYRNGVRNTGRPVQIVASHANTATALGIEISMLAAPKNASASGAMPVANMWCTHTSKPISIVATVDTATASYATSGRRQKVGNASDTMPIAGSTTT
ncbi:hypothetical protein BamIOP4010DRAFT_6800 [Burkholderia ambifaria IOP40-10]|uniref:Uncharacterized protein n=1 Tax=Burkholderia ambifaria IOP40-10 TaxID=396596 RepID=B1FRY7_9BURK|nr:hypothetical protein BamIOP4010DRAFT_6800 [Burkholderia ambifaria IOP40-10]